MRQRIGLTSSNSLGFCCSNKLSRSTSILIHSSPQESHQECCIRPTVKFSLFLDQLISVAHNLTHRLWTYLANGRVLCASWQHSKVIPLPPLSATSHHEESFPVHQRGWKKGDCVGGRAAVRGLKQYWLMSCFLFDLGSFYGDKPDISLNDKFSGHLTGLHNRNERGAMTRGW